MKTLTVPRSLRLFASGECVEPGLYRDIETGATIRMLEHDELPDRVVLVRVKRRFTRVDRPEASASAALVA